MSSKRKVTSRIAANRQPSYRFTIGLCLTISLVGFLFYSCESIDSKQTKSTGWKTVYKHDENVHPLEGSIDSLIAGIRKGYDMRIGWGWEKPLGDSILKLEHVAEPLFTSIIQEKSVSVVIDPHPLLKSYVHSQAQTIGEGGHIWQCVLTTSGTFNAQVYHRSTGQLINDWPQRHRMVWYLEYP
jgi:hypothetical protein